METAAPRNTKLISLLGLSAGAVGLTHIAEAQIVYSDVSDQTVGAGFSSNYTLDLPGAHDLQLFTSSPPPYSTTTVEFGNNAYGRVRVYGGSGVNAPFAARATAGATWDMIGGGEAVTGRIGERTGVSSGGVIGPGSFSNSYVAFKFQDTTAGGADRYGWAYLSMTVGPGFGPNVTLHSYAYDASGAEIAMGATTAIPEPGTSAAIAAFGALALGGVRRWRASKTARAVTVAA